MLCRVHNIDRAPELRRTDRPRGAGGARPRGGAGRSPAGRGRRASGTAPCCDGPRGNGPRARHGRWRGPPPAGCPRTARLTRGGRSVGPRRAQAGLVLRRQRRTTEQRPERHAKRLGGDLVGAGHGHVIEEPYRCAGADALLVDPHTLAQASRRDRARARRAEQARVGGRESGGQRPAGGSGMEGDHFAVGHDGDAAADTVRDQARRCGGGRIGEGRFGGGEPELGMEPGKVPRLIGEVGRCALGQRRSSVDG